MSLQVQSDYLYLRLVLNPLVMKYCKGMFIIVTLLTISIYVCAQDEGPISKKVAFAKGRSFYLIGGPSFHLGKGDYSSGLNLEAGYLVRLNRTLSIGPCVY